MTEDNRDTNPEEPARPEAPAADEGRDGAPPAARSDSGAGADQPPTAPDELSPPPAAGVSPYSAPPAAPSYGDQSPGGVSPYAGQSAGAPAFGSQAPYTAPPGGSFAGSSEDTPPRGYPAPPAQGDRVLYGTAFTQPGLGTPPRTGAYPSLSPPPAAGGQSTTPPGQPPRRRTGLVAGLTVLALLVGGGAGAVGGYLVADNKVSSGPVANALDRPPPSEQTSAAADGTVEQVAEKVLPTVVQLQVRGQGSAGEGSGFVISSDGLIVTNNHVVEAAARDGEIVAVFHDGSTASAEIVGRDPTSDVAVVRADKTGLAVSDLGRSDDLRVGEGVVAFGSPFELSGTVTSGIVSALQRPQRAGGGDGSQATVMDAIQTDAAINPGNSGGPLVNMRGQVIGINSAIYSPTQSGSVGIGFAIPIDQARRTADEIVKTGKATQTILGVTVRDNEDGGALIVEVTPDGPGAKAGLKQGDVVVKLDERRIDTSDALVAAVRSHKPDDKVNLELSNGSRTVGATLAGQPVETE
ncbi:S1C family serine protease [Actinophytocola sediminis]